jgi:hypothetical protein
MSGNVVQGIPLSASLLGDTTEVKLRLEVDRTYVPAELPGSEHPDARELGFRVLGVYLSDSE